MDMFIDKKIKMLCKDLERLSVVKTEKIPEYEYVKSGYKQTNTPPKSGYVTVKNCFRFGGVDSHYWLHFTVNANSRENQYINLSFRTGREELWDGTNPQGLIYINGKMVQGIDIHHTDVILENGNNDVYFYLYAGMEEGDFDFEVSLNTVDIRIEKAYYDFFVPYETAMCFKPTDNNSVQILKQLEIAANMIDFREEYSEEFFATLKEAEDYLQSEFYGKLCGKSDSTVNCVGHTHIDVAWLWTLAQTREKAQRSFATVLNYMRQYPEYKFMSSQPQLYMYVKESAPEIFNEIKQRIAEGRWEAEGGMWLEADCNLISGESMVRQLIHGKRFMKDEFGIDSKTVWLPDVFGYSAAMPQVLKKCGIENFVTSKISWNDINRLPYDTFMWEGIDGSEIFSTFITTQESSPDGETTNYTTYVGMLEPSHILGTWNRYQQKEYNNETVITYGYGDGGGGPTKWMIENQRRLHYGLPGMPKTQPSVSGEFLKKAHEKFIRSTQELKRTPKWVGELYLEKHRGTYTSIGKNKKNNRECEFLLQKTEALCGIENTLWAVEYPEETFYSCWQTVLLNQFHDIIPGSSIKQVYDDSNKDYLGVRNAVGGKLSVALQFIAKNVAATAGTLVYNPTGFTAPGIVKINGESYETEEIPAYGWKVIDPKKAECQVKICGNTIENGYYKLSLDNAGRIDSLFDKRNMREVVKNGEKGNELQIFEDIPYDFDNWEIACYYKQKMWILDTDAEITPFYDNVGAGFTVKHKYMKSVITQNIRLYNECERIDFETNLDWHEHHQMIKAAFPLDIHASHATYDIQYGNLERTTNENTSWEAAKFEVCAHKWADISETGYGVSLLNNCKYGYSAEGSTLKLTLLKCGTYPNPEADQGEHSFTYSLLPHSGDFRNGGIVKAAYLFNNPMETVAVTNDSGNLSNEFSAISVNRENAVIDTIKKAYDSNDIVVRLFDSFDMRTEVTINVGFDFKSAVLCDMLENEISELETSGSCITLPLKNFEIATVKIKK